MALGGPGAHSINAKGSADFEGQEVNHSVAENMWWHPVNSIKWSLPQIRADYDDAGEYMNKEVWISK